MKLGILTSVVSLFFWANSVLDEQAVCNNFKGLLVDIRTQQIKPNDARLRFRFIVQELRRLYPPQNIDSANVQLTFPLVGKSYRSIGGKNGNGFRASGFNLFDHTVQGSHPAHDIFIYDRNQDCIDDRTNDYVGVVAVSDGLIVASETGWTPDMDYRGGNYVWLYDFQTGGLWYFAHLREVYVHAGQSVKVGDKMGEVGRTGFNALAKRSDTHLHLMHLAIDLEGNPRPLNHFDWLKNARTVNTANIPFYNPIRRALTEKLTRVAPKKAAIKQPKINYPMVSYDDNLFYNPNYPRRKRK